MYCNHCKKEEETVTIAGVTYCANCSTALVENKDSGQARMTEGDVPTHKIPKIEETDNLIRTEEVPSMPKEENQEIRELSRETSLPEVGKDELGSSAILLDILSDTAKEETDAETVEKDERLEEASEEVIDLLGQDEAKETPALKEVEVSVPEISARKAEVPVPEGVGVPTAVSETKYAPNAGNNHIMNDVVIEKRKGYLEKKHKNIVRAAEEEIKDEVQMAGRIVTSESGYTKEWDLMIMSIALTALALVILAIFITFK
ncbi:hypothetical protein C4544_06350 [candidate division WS5 bacterium]|uniref:Uncharacterized protein n=1 Tax=candidate division WS5 bacterium TaxID=2093353 RepID=A0A419DA40_9BACT|nr:MAG: hypothetical protein C4544_06350 [candidate division WS5 bacterium]